MKKRILSLLLMLCLVVGVLPMAASAATADRFTDVAKNSWYYDYVDYVTTKGYFRGTTDTTFSPDRNMTRAMFVVVLARYDGVKVDNSKSSFSDVAPGAWCAGAVNWAAENKIIEGYPDGTFDPNASITRAQMCAIMDRYINYYTAKHGVKVEKKGSQVDLADQSAIPAYAKTAVKNCQTYGLIYGYEDGTFRPKMTSSRAHVAAVLYRLSFLVESAKPSGGGSSGGSGGSSTVTTTDTYVVKVKLDPADGITSRALELMGDYQISTTGATKTGDTTVAQLAHELVTGRENENALTNAISEALAQAKDKTVRTDINGEDVTITVSDDLVISATATVPVADIVNGSGSGTRTLFTVRAAVSAGDIEALVGKLEQGGDLTLTVQDVAALDKLMEKLNSMETSEILDYVQENGSEAMKQAAAGMTEEALEEARTSYTAQLEKIQTQVEDAVEDNDGNVAVSVEKPVTMTVRINLENYVDKAVEKYEKPENKDKFVNKLGEKLGTEKLEEPAVKAAIDELYALYNPGDFVELDGDSDVKLLTAGDYYDMLVDYVDATAKLWVALGEDEAFYAEWIGKAQNRADQYDFVDVSVNGAVAALLGTTGKIVNEVTGDILAVTATVDDTTYPEVRDLVAGKLTGLGYGAAADLIPGTAPAKLMGDYKLTITIERQLVSL